MAFDRERVAIVHLQPLRLLVERRARLRRELGRIRFEEHAVAHVHHEILLAAGGRRAGANRSRIGIAGTGRKREPRRQRCGQLEAAPSVHRNGHLVTPSSRLTEHLPAGLAAGSLSEGSVNLDGLLQRPVESAKAPESFRNG